MAKLTKKQKRFCEEYIVDLSAKNAAIRAGYSAKSAADIGCDLLKDEAIAAEIDVQMAELSKRTGITAERVLLEISKIAFCNPADIVKLNLDDEKDREKASAIASIKTKEIPTRGGGIAVEREIRIGDNKIKALELCGKHIGLFKDKIELGTEGGTIKVELGGELGEWAK